MRLSSGERADSFRPAEGADAASRRRFRILSPFLLPLLLPLALLSLARCGRLAGGRTGAEGILYVVVVCHAESDPWNCEHFGLQFGLPAMAGIFRRVEQRSGLPLRTTYCENPPVARPEYYGSLFQQLVADGHELGIHSQGGTDRAGRPHRDLGPADNEQRIPGDVRELVELGFPRPTTYAPGDWGYLPTTTRLLEEAGIEVSCSALPSLKEEGKYDYRRLSTFFPYHPGYGDNSIPGEARLLEIPVSAMIAWLARSGEPRAAASLPPWPPGGDNFEGVTSHLRERLEAVCRRRGVDVFQIVWHPWEAIAKVHNDWPSTDANVTLNRRYLEQAERWLTETASLPGVRFVTASEAAAAWKQSVSASR